MDAHHLGWCDFDLVFVFCLGSSGDQYHLTLFQRLRYWLPFISLCKPAPREASGLMGLV